MNAELLAIWNSEYAPDLGSAPLKLRLGADAYRRAAGGDSAALVSAFSGLVNSARADLNVGRLLPSFAETREYIDRSVKAQSDRVIEAIRGRDDVDKVKDKLTSKGPAAERDFVDVLLANPHIASASRLREKDQRGKFGGDIIASDHVGNVCVVELKNKATLTLADFDKFEEDVRTCEIADAIFIFARVSGAGSCRRFHAKPLFERTNSGRIVIWFKGTGADLEQQLPLLLSCAASVNQIPNQSDGRAALRVAASELEDVLRDVRSEICATETRKLALQKRERTLVQAVEAARAADVPFPKKARVVKESTPRTMDA